MANRCESWGRFEPLEQRWSPAAVLPSALAAPLAGEVARMFEPYVNTSAFAQSLTAAGVKMYGAFWCPHCNAQKALFGDAVSELPYVECSNPDRTQTQAAIDNNITSYPTWIWGNGTRDVGVLTLEEIATKSGVALPVVSTETQFEQALDNVMAQFSQSGTGLSADLDDDGRVNFDDFAVLKENRPAQAGNAALPPPAATAGPVVPPGSSVNG